MAPSSVDAVVAVGKKPEGAVEEHTLGAIPDTIDVPPFSVNICSYPLQWLLLPRDPIRFLFMR